MKAIITVEQVLKLETLKASLASQYAMDKLEHAVRTWFGRQKKTTEAGKASGNFNLAKRIGKNKATSAEVWESGDTESHIFNSELALLQCKAKNGFTAIGVSGFDDGTTAVWLAPYLLTASQPATKVAGSRNGGSRKPASQPVTV